MTEDFTNIPDLKALFALNDELQTLVRTLVPGVYLLPGHVTREQSIALFALTKACKTHGAVLTLCRTGYGEDASILSRSMFEQAVDMLYLGQDQSGQMAERYLDHDWALRYEMLHVLESDPFFADRQPSEEQKPTVAEIDREAHRAQKRWKFWKGVNASGRLVGFGGHWAVKSIRDAAVAVGWGSHYYTMYRVISQLVHSSSQAANQYVKILDDDTVHLNATPSRNYLGHALFTGFVYLHQTALYWRAVTRPSDEHLEQRLAALDQQINQLMTERFGPERTAWAAKVADDAMMSARPATA